MLDSTGTRRELQTLTIATVLTPEYASPEQARRETITTASDIYSLGVVLYELLTGQRPYQIRTQRPDEIARIITEQNPARPSTVAAERRESRPVRRESSGACALSDPRALRGDLDNIVLMAMRKEPQRRYA